MKRPQFFFGNNDSDEDDDNITYVVKYDYECVERWMQYKLTFVGGTTRKLWREDDAYASEYHTEPSLDSRIVEVDNVITREIVDKKEYLYMKHKSKEYYSASAAISMYRVKYDTDGYENVHIETL
jgi:hypothetical protein